MTMGRPTKYSQEIADKILQRLSEGETVTAISKDKDMPNKSTIILWSAVHKDFSDQYVMAMKASGQFRADQIIETLNDMRQGVLDPQIGNIEINALKWLASKHYPKQYGDKQTIESKNENLNINTDVSLSEEDLAILRRFGFNSKE